MNKEWLFKKKEHQELYKILYNLEIAAVREKQISQEPSKEAMDEIVANLSLNREDGTRPVVICETIPFVVYMNNEELTTFPLYKAKLQSIRPSMDMECWQHWTTVRGAFWRHQDILLL